MAGLIKVEKLEPRERRRPKVEWTGWGQDIMRHTFASHYLAVYGAKQTVEQLGHGDYDMLFGHYRSAVTRKAGREYFSLTPRKVL